MALRSTTLSGAVASLVNTVTGTAGEVSATPTSGNVVVGLPASLILTGKTVTGLNTIAPGTSDGVTYVTETATYGGNSHASQASIGQTTAAVSTVATTIITVPGDGSLLAVCGSDGTNKFADTIMANLTTVNVIGTGTAAGAPAARTYSNTTAGVIKLAMATGTYNINVFGFTAGQR